MTKHSKGPWINIGYDKESSTIVIDADPKGECCYQVVRVFFLECDRAKAEANANLIASSPSLLKICKKLAKSKYVMNSLYNDYKEELLNAIAKAEGK